MDKKKAWKDAMHTWNIEAKSINNLMETINIEDFIKCIEIIRDCQGKIITAGVGTSAAAAIKIAHSLSCIEHPSFFLSPGDAVHGALGSVQNNDIVILISKGGNTEEIINIIPSLKIKKVIIIGVTENEDSVLAKNSDLLMKIQVKEEADAFNMLATTSTITVIAVFDAVCIALMNLTKYSKEQFAIIHPGGAVGKRLLEETK
jgi:KpsF/GutQ family protein